MTGQGSVQLEAGQAEARPCRQRLTPGSRAARGLAVLCATFLLGSGPLSGQVPTAAVPDGVSFALLQAEAVEAHIQIAREQDALIARELKARLSLIESLREVEVEVAAGVVVLRGALADDSRRELARRVAESVPGVIAVDDRLELDTALDRRIQPVMSTAIERLKRLGRSLPLLAVSLLVVYVFHLLGRLLTAWRRPFRRLDGNPFLRDLLQRALHVAIVVAGILVALDLLGATTVVGAVVGAAGLAGLALGFAFRDLAENYIASILLSLRQPFAPNDHVVIDGHEGRVAALNSRATILITLDGNHLRLANALVFKAVILNYTRNPTRRFEFELGVGSQEDLAAAQLLAMEAMRATPGVIAQPEPRALIQAVADSSVTLRCLAWVDQRQASVGKVRSEAILAVKRALEAAGMDLPEPTFRIQLGSAPDSAAAPLARPAPPKVPPHPIHAPSVDVSVETYLQDQVQREQLAQGDNNLLSEAAPKE
jgi:small conductance mechanosensitive channel